MSGTSLLPASGLELLLHRIGFTLVPLLAGTILFPLAGLVLLLPAGAVLLPKADLVLPLLCEGVDPIHPLHAGLLLHSTRQGEHLLLPGGGLDFLHRGAGLLQSGTGLGKHLLIPGGGLDPAPLLAFTILLSVALVCLLPGNGLDPVLSVAGSILLPGADLLLFSVRQWDLGLVHALVGTILLPRADPIPLPAPGLAGLNLQT